jgi:hypothetical protein
MFGLIAVSNKLLDLLLLHSAHFGYLCGAKVADQLSFYEVKVSCWTKAMGFDVEIVNMPSPHM